MTSRLIIADICSQRIEGKVVGHYYTVAQNYLEIFKNIVEVKIAGGPIYKEKFKEEDLILLDFDTDSSFSFVKNKKRELHNIRQLFRTCKDDIIIFQSSAVATVYVGILLWAKKQKIYMIQYNKMSLDSKLKETIYKFAKSKIQGMICSTCKIGEAYKIPYCIISDYIYTEKKSKIEYIPYDLKKYDFSMLGIITKDKGVVEAARKLAGTQYSVLLAGYSVDSDIRNELISICKNCGNIELRFKYLEEIEYVQEIQNSRYCILNYSSAYSEHSSGVVYDVIFNGTPVVGTKCTSLDFIREKGLGYIYEDINEFDFENIMNEKQYKLFIKGIEEYKVEQKNYRNTLINFLQL